MNGDTCLVLGCTSTAGGDGFCADHCGNWGELAAAAADRGRPALTLGTGATIGLGEEVGPCLPAPRASSHPVVERQVRVCTST